MVLRIRGIANTGSVYLARERKTKYIVALKVTEDHNWHYMSLYTELDLADKIHPLLGASKSTTSQSWRGASTAARN